MPYCSPLCLRRASAAFEGLTAHSIVCCCDFGCACPALVDRASWRSQLPRRRGEFVAEVKCERATVVPGALLRVLSVCCILNAVGADSVRCCHGELCTCQQMVVRVDLH
jgi:hypothetical protein